MDQLPRQALVCDDDPMIVAIASMLLRDAGFGVTATSSGAELTVALASLQPDVVVLDQELPDASGEGLVGAILVAAPACRVILFSGREVPDTPGREVFARVSKRGTADLAAAIQRAAAE